MENNNRIYQLSNEQLNTISSDLIEAIILLSGKKNQKGLLDEIRNLSKTLNFDIETAYNVQSELKEVIEKLDEIYKFSEQENFRFEAYKQKKDEDFNRFNKKVEDDFIENSKNLTKLNNSIAEKYSKTVNDLNNIDSSLKKQIAQANEITLDFKKMSKTFIYLIFGFGLGFGLFLGFVTSSFIKL
ncbi:hypothetical protein NG783_10440 [Aliarcobacter cryaerophilus]|uniref:hypothetical protein n=1 Tax=Aliarcobacter cryaerophilus TaxID=28198 RepID=UPI003DA25798